MRIYSFNIFLLPMLHSIFCQQVDENRPYKFGFNIDGYQHRQEEKNEKGLIKGEYGFITADGYYRVTKYETDENGDFRIISMKNYYVGFPPENPTTLQPMSFPKKVPPQKLKKLDEPKLYSVLKGEPPKQNGKTNLLNPVLPTTQIPVLPANKEYSIPITYERTTKRPISFQGQAGCSHCIIPTTEGPSTTDPRKYSVDYRVDLKFLDMTSEHPEEKGKLERQNKFLPEKSALIKNEPNLKLKETNFGSSDNFTKNNGDKNRKGPIGFKNHTLLEKSAVVKDPLNLKRKDNNINNTANNNDKNSNGLDFKIPFSKVEKDVNVYRLPLRFNETINSKQQHVENIQNAINNTSSGNNRLLPRNDLKKFKNISIPKSGFDGTGKSEIDQDAKNKLLYTFNYTVDFHGHHEDGFRNGEKEGDYFVGGKDGVQRKVNYFANEFGYQPNITLSDLDENDISRINESSQKHTGLKGYEFKWFYRR